MWLHLGTALLLLMAILRPSTFVARQIARPLRHLAEVTDTVRRTGDHTPRAPSGTAATRSAGSSSASTTCSRSSTASARSQKELAASARAADAQRELVEATPIPLVVTVGPGPRGAARQPAGRGLADAAAAPIRGSRGSTSAVRARFFQQLSDRGAVDEFEVQWRAGVEPAWAVLSARRVSFQGQDAVLTAFTPINHLKLMERRLELWAKVFEASSEGILIIDAGRRILTANQALSRHTGYDLQEVVGEKPSLMLGGRRRRRRSALARRRRARHLAGRADGAAAQRQRVPGLADGQRGSRTSQGDISHYIFTSIDISDRKKSEQRIQLPRRPRRADRAAQPLAVHRAAAAGDAAGRAQRARRSAVLFIDLDRFKDINDSLGHHIGDGLLRSVAQRLLEAVRGGDTVSRLGGDEFVVVLNGVQDADEVAHIVDQRLIPLIRQPHQVEGADLHVSCSVGIALFPDDATDIDELMRHADTAMYQAKAAGRDGAEFFTAEMTERAQLAHAARGAPAPRAGAASSSQLHYQPRIDATSGEMIGVEGLLRWQHPELGMVLARRTSFRWPRRAA